MLVLEQKLDVVPPTIKTTLPATVAPEPSTFIKIRETLGKETETLKLKLTQKFGVTGAFPIRFVPSTAT